MSELLKLEERAIEYLKAFEPSTEPYYLAYSGGKDSDAIKILANLAGVKFEAVHNLTTADTPETVNYVKSQKDVRINKAFDKDGNHVTMWNLIPQKLLPPTRLMRYCCAELKERGGKERVVITGVRKAESNSRAESSEIVRIVGKPKTTIKQAEIAGVEYKQTKQGGYFLTTIMTQIGAL